MGVRWGEKQELEVGKTRRWGAPLRLGVGLGQAERQFPESIKSKGGREVMRVLWGPLPSYQEGSENWPGRYRTE